MHYGFFIFFACSYAFKSKKPCCGFGARLRCNWLAPEADLSPICYNENSAAERRRELAFKKRQPGIAKQSSARGGRTEGPASAKLPPDPRQEGNNFIKIRRKSHMAAKPQMHSYDVPGLWLPLTPASSAPPTTGRRAASALKVSPSLLS